MKSFYEFYKQVLREAVPDRPENDANRPAPPAPEQAPDASGGEMPVPDGEGDAAPQNPSAAPAGGPAPNPGPPPAPGGEMPAVASKERGTGVAPPVPNPNNDEKAAAGEISALMQSFDKQTQDAMKQAMGGMLPDEPQPTPQAPAPTPQAAPAPAPATAPPQTAPQM